MVWVKSIAVGIAVVITISLIASVAIPIMLSRIAKSGQAFWNPLSAFQSPIGLLFLALIFAIGFGWEYHRLAAGGPSNALHFSNTPGAMYTSNLLTELRSNRVSTYSSVSSPPCNILELGGGPSSLFLHNA